MWLRISVRVMYWVVAPIVLGCLSYVLANGLVDRVDWLNKLESSEINKRSITATEGTLVSTNVVLVEIDNHCLETLRSKGARLDRREYARAMIVLKQAGASSALFDCYFGRPQPVEDSELKGAIRRVGPEWLTFGYASKEMSSEDDPSEPDGRRVEFPVAPFLTLDRTYYGNLELFVTEDGIAVGQVLGRRDRASNETVFSAALMTYLKARRISVQDVRWHKSEHVFEADGIEWRTQGNDNLIISWPDRGESFMAYDLANVLNEMTDDDRSRAFDGKIVVLGTPSETDSPSVSDSWMTPIGEMQGIQIHALIVNSLAQSARNRLSATAYPVHLTWGMMLATLVAFAWWSRRLYVGVPIIAGVVAIALLVPPWIARVDHKLIETVSPLLGVALSSTLCGVFTRLVPEPRRSAGTVFEGTVVLFDMKGSTELIGSLGPWAYARVFAQWERQVSRLARRYRGEIERTTGDGAVVVFPVRIGSNHAERAIRFAQRVLGIALPEGARVFAGIESGAFTGDYVWEAGRLMWSSASLAMNKASRLESIAANEDVSICLGATSHGLLSETSYTILLGEYELKGFEHPESVWGVVSLGGDFESQKKLDRDIGDPHDASVR